MADNLFQKEREKILHLFAQLVAIEVKMCHAKEVTTSMVAKERLAIDKLLALMHQEAMSDEEFNSVSL